MKGLPNGNPNAIKVNPSDFYRIGRRPPLGRYLSETWNLRHFLLAQARFKALTTGRGTYLGRFWLLLEPFLRVAMYFVIFGLILKVSRGMDNFIAFLAIGIILFRSLSGALTSGSTVLTRHRSIVRGFAFPRISLILSDSLRSAYDAVPDLVVLLVFIWILPPHEVPQWTWLLMVPLLTIAHVLVTGIMLMTAWLSSLLPDVKHLWPLITRFWFYASGVIFPIDKFVSDSTALLVLNANPAALVLNMAREILMDGTVPRFTLWMQLVGWACALASFGVLLFWSREEAYNRAR